MIVLIGWAGSILCALCGIPEAFRSIRNKSCGAGWGLLGCWGVGEVLLFVYICFNWDTALFVNYAANIICVSIMVYYKLKGV